MSKYYIGDLWFESDPCDTMEHHGIMGQKWGVRRFQNYDGTYTSEGLARRYGDTGGDDRAGASRFHKVMNSVGDSVKEKLRSTFKPTAEEKAERKAEKEAKAQAREAKREAREQQKEAERELKAAAEKEKILKNGSAEDVLRISADLTPNELQAAVNRLRNQDALKQMIENKNDKKREHKSLMDCLNAADNLLSRYTSIKQNIDKLKQASEEKEKKEDERRRKEDEKRRHSAAQEYAKKVTRSYTETMAKEIESGNKNWFPSADDMATINKQIAAYNLLADASEGVFGGGGKKK